MSGSTRTLLAITQYVMRAGRRPYLGEGVGAIVSFDEIYHNPDTDSSAMMRSFKGCTFALGPVLTYRTNIGEFGATNHSAGHSYYLNISAAF